MHDQYGKVLIHKFKYQDKTYLAPYYAKWMLKIGCRLIQEVDLIIPVPMHKLRLLRRLYNQAALLAYYLSKYTDLPMYAHLLIRQNYTKAQFGLTKQERIQNVHNAFIINPRLAYLLKAKNILLVDDVFTTGATINACTKVILAAGASSVKVLTLARTIIN